MPFTLNVQFNGACAYIPHKENKKGLLVLLPDARKAEAIEHQKKWGVVPSHFAYLLFPLANLSPRSKRREEYVVGAGNERNGVIFLDGDEVLLPGGNGGLFLDDLSLKGQSPTPGEETSLQWVADMTKICNKRQLDARFLKSPPPSEIAARIPLSAGRLSTSYVNQNEVYEFTPQPDNGPYTQCFAQRVKLSATIEKDTAIVRFKNHEGNKGDSLELQSTPGETTIEVGNTPLDDLFRRDTFHPKIDYDFAVLYRLTTSNGKEAHGFHLPQSVDEGQKWQGSPCIGGRFAPAEYP